MSAITLSEMEKIRYSRQIMIPNWGESCQARLKASTVLIAGAGGLGSPNAFYLASAGIGHIIICDYDVIEMSNLNRQILHDQHRIGQYKAESARQTIRDLNPNVEVTCVVEKITPRNVSSLLEGVDIIIDCLDNLETRLLLNKKAFERRIPMVHGSIWGMEGRVALLHPPYTACLQCIFSEPFGNETFPAVGPTVGVIGSLQALEAIKYITSVGETLSNKFLMWDGYANRFNIGQVHKKDDCEICGQENMEIGNEAEITF